MVGLGEKHDPTLPARFTERFFFSDEAGIQQGGYCRLKPDACNNYREGYFAPLSVLLKSVRARARCPALSIVFWYFSDAASVLCSRLNRFTARECRLSLWGKTRSFQQKLPVYDLAWFP